MRRIDMVTSRVLTGVVIAAVTAAWPVAANAQSAAGATVAKGNTRAMGKPFSGRLSAVAARDATPPAPQLGMLYAVLDYKGKLAVNGTFEGLASAATAASFHLGKEGQRGPKVATLTVTKATGGVVKGDILLSEADIAELQKGAYYVQIETEKGRDGEVRGWLLPGMLK